MTFGYSVLFGSPDILEIYVVVRSIGNSNQFSLSKIINAFIIAKKNHSWHTCKYILANGGLCLHCHIKP